MRVRLPPGAFYGGGAFSQKEVASASVSGVWESLGNPRAPEARDRRFESGHADLLANDIAVVLVLVRAGVC